MKKLLRLTAISTLVFVVAANVVVVCGTINNPNFWTFPGMFLVSMFAIVLVMAMLRFSEMGE